MSKLLLCYPILALATMGLCACATSAPQTRAALKQGLPIPASMQISDVTYSPQTEGDCGPSALTSVVRWAGRSVEFATIKNEVYTPSRNGSLPADLISSSRRQGLLAIPITGMTALLQELAMGNPVIVFENRAFGFWPRWHYDVATGYDTDKQEITLLSQNPAGEKLPMTHFEHYWSGGDYWGLLVIPPQKLSATGDELAHARAAAGLELAEKYPEAEIAYHSVLRRFPQSLPALIGLGNLYFRKSNLMAAQAFLKKALALHPTSSAAKNNLAVIEAALKAPKRKH